MTQHHTPPDGGASPARVAFDQRINPDRRRAAFVSSEGVSATWKGVIMFGAIMGVLAATWTVVKTASAIQDTPAALAQQATVVKSVADSVNSIGNQVRTMARDFGSLQTRVGTIEQRLQVEENKSSAMDAAKAASDRIHQDLSDRVREIEMRTSAGAMRRYP